MPNKLFDQQVDRRNSDSFAWKRFGPEVLPFWVADMDFLAPPEIIEAIKKRADHGVFGYGDGYPELREIFSERMQRLFSWKISADEIKCTAGILPIFYFLLCHLLKQDESVLLFTPAYPPFFKLIKESGRNLIEYKLEERVDNSTLSYGIDFDNLKNLVTTKTKILVLCSPHNPVGKVFLREDLEKLTSFCLERGIIIISDEIHSELVLDGQHIPTASISKEVAQSVITLCGPTKTFNLPGLKVAHLVIQNPELRREIFEASFEAVADVSPLAAAATRAAYAHCDYWKNELLIYLKENRDFANKFIRQRFPEAALTLPAATYLTWINMSYYRADKSPFETALSKGKIACGYGKAFGNDYEDYLRLSLACPRAMLTEGLERLSRAWEL